MPTLLPRLRLFEFEDLPWCPTSWRDLMTDYLRWLQETFAVYEIAFEKLEEVIRKAKITSIVDLCSGLGGPSPLLRQRLADKGLAPEMVLTDRYPPDQPHAVVPATVPYCTEPVDARRVPPALKGFRTLFTSFHHLSPAEAAEVLKNASDSGIAVFEITDRSISGLLRVMLLALAYPFVSLFRRPFKTSRLMWSIVPVLPLLIFWDGIASHFRSYTTAELKSLAHRAGLFGRARVGTLRSSFGVSITYLIVEPPQRC